MPDCHVREYEPIVLQVGMNDYGYRFVTISVAPGRRLTITVCLQGATVAESIAAALDHLTSMPDVKVVRT